mgnify:CR=1 FL=1
MLRITLVVIGIFLLGTLLGLGISLPQQTNHSTKTPNQEPNTMQNELYQETLSQKEALIEELGLEITRLSEHYNKTTSQLEALNTSLENMESAPLPNSQDPKITPEEDAISDEEDNAEQRSSEERKNEFVDRMRDTMLDTWAEEWDKASPESQERIASIAESQQKLLDIRLEMRNADTEQKQEKLQQDYESIRKYLQDTLHTEQNAQLSTLAQRYGISGQENIDRFIADTRNQLQTPVFQTESQRGRGSSFGGPRGERSGRDRNRGGFR